MGIVYILQSEKNGKYYIGSTNNIIRRLQQHNSLIHPTSKRLGPFILKFKQEYSTLTEARKVEIKLKQLKRRDYLQKIINSGKITLQGH